MSEMLDLLLHCVANARFTMSVYNGNSKYKENCKKSPGHKPKEWKVGLEDRNIVAHFDTCST